MNKFCFSEVLSIIIFLVNIKTDMKELRSIFHLDRQLSLVLPNNNRMIFTFNQNRSLLAFETGNLFNQK